jgi:F0F1-type ATP synthase epsilon subunit
MPVNPLTLTVKNRDGTIFFGEVISLTSFNEKGKFDVLPKHANFISLINKSIDLKLRNGKNKYIEIENGVIKVENNKVDIYLGIGKSPTV